MKRASRIFCFAMLAICIVTLPSCQPGKPKDEWMTIFFSHSIDPMATNHEFALYELEQQRFHLFGICRYANYEKVSRALADVVIPGARTSDGRFWPDVSLQVQDHTSGRWKTLTHANHWWELSKKRAVVTIEPDGANLELHVNLDAFQPVLRDYKMGRLVLKNGEACEFELRTLEPPMDMKNPAGSQNGKSTTGSPPNI